MYIKKHAKICSLLIFITLLVAADLPKPLPQEPWSFAVIGDSRNGPKTFSKLLQLMLDDPYRPELMFHTGDMVNKGGNMDEWAQYKKCISILEGRITVYPVIGNHETFGKNGTKNYITEAKPPREALYYGFKYKNAGFISLHCYDPKNFIKIGPEQMEWLKKTLREMRPIVSAIFVFLHHPLIAKPAYVHKEPLKNADEVWTVLRESGITAVFAGHEHTYDHAVKGGVHHFISAGGGAPLYRKGGDPFYHYCRVVMQPKQVRVTAIGLDGTERKEITIPIRSVSNPD